jgi:hypothetical protein
LRFLAGRPVHRWVVEGAIALLHWFRRLRIRSEIGRPAGERRARPAGKVRGADGNHGCGQADSANRRITDALGTQGAKPGPDDEEDGDSASGQLSDTRPHPLDDQSGLLIINVNFI